jgi:hypothetical protein
MLPVDATPPSAELAAQLGNLALVTVHPDHIAPSVLGVIDIVVVVGPAPDEVMKAFQWPQKSNHSMPAA